MKSTSTIPVFLLMLCSVSACVAPRTAQESRWGSPDEETVKLMLAVEAMWSNSNCSPQPDLKDFIADDFQGTFTSGRRFGKDEAIAADPELMKLSRDCQLGEVRVRFFGDSVAIAYGAENRMRKDKEGREAKRCQAWTDTWLKRNERWQIVAAQDTLVSCSQ